MPQAPTDPDRCHSLAVLAAVEHTPPACLYFSPHSPFSVAGIPVDKQTKTYFIMCLLGCGLLLPWNAVLTAFDYFQTLYDDKTFAFGVPISNQATNFVILLAMIKYGTQWSFTKRIVAMFIVYDVLLIMLPPIGMLVGAGYKELSLILTYACFCGFGCATAVLQSSLFGFAGLLPPEYTQAIMAGQGVSGVFMNILMMVCQASLSATPGSDSGTIEAWMFFGLAAVVVLACIFAYGLMVRRRFIRYHIPDVDETGHMPVTREEEEEYRRRQEEVDSILQAPPSPEARPPLPPSSPALEGAVPLLGGDDSMTLKTGELGHALLSPTRGSYGQLSASEGGHSRSLSNTTSSTQGGGTSSFGSGIPVDPRLGVVRNRSATDQAALGMASPDDYSFKSLFDDKFVKKKRGSSKSREGSKTSSPLISPAGSPEIPELRFSDSKEISALDLSRGGPVQWDECEGGDLETPEVDSWKVFMSIFYHGGTVFSLFAVSLFLFPGFMTVACATGPFESMGNSWYRLILITSFNTFDTAGRLVAPSLNGYIHKQCLWITAVGRLALIPLFYWFVYDDITWWWGPLAFTCVLGLTNGLFGSICMMRGPMEVEHHEREMAGTLMAFCLMMGIIAGSFVQLGAGQLLKRDGIGSCGSAGHNATHHGNTTQLAFSHMQIAGAAMLRI